MRFTWGRCAACGHPGRLVAQLVIRPRAGVRRTCVDLATCARRRGLR